MANICVGNVNFIVDEDDYIFYNNYKWVAHNTGTHIYASRLVGGRRIYLHRLILRAPRVSIVDHINRNTLDNRKINLRLVSGSINGFNKAKDPNNSSGFRGVSKQTVAKYGKCKYPWRANIDIQGKRIFVGTYETPEQAAKAYDKKAFEYHKQIDLLNFPEDYAHCHVEL